MLINKEKAVALLEEKIKSYAGQKDEQIKISAARTCLEIIKNMQSTSVIRPSHILNDPRTGRKITCGNCRYEYRYENYMRFCPCCGYKIAEEGGIK